MGRMLTERPLRDAVDGGWKWRRRCLMLTRRGDCILG